jgi:hypothetical protein
MRLVEMSFEKDGWSAPMASGSPQQSPGSEGTSWVPKGKATLAEMAKLPQAIAIVTAIC